MREDIASITVELGYCPVVNFASQQNHVPAIRNLIIKNVSGRNLENIQIDILAEPEFSNNWSTKIDRILPDELIDLGVINLRLSSKFLSELTERITGFFTVRLSSNSEELYSETYPVDVLAFDQWMGLSILPEMLSAFVIPNHPEIPKIIKRASEILSKWSGNPSFDEYQSRNPDRVKKQMAAIYEAISERQIVYCSVPASFEQLGQRVRLADTVLSTQMGNCLDLSLLYASCLESVGINPLIIATKGHAFSGAWLIDDTFPDCANDDMSLLTKKIAEGINEIIVVESTAMNAGQNISFDLASKAGNNRFLKEDEFQMFLDVKRSRFSGIRPIPQRIYLDDRWQIVEEKLSVRDAEKPEEIVTTNKIVNITKIDVGKQQLWERKLLDLSLRNNLLNLRLTKNSIQIISISLSKLEDELAGNKEFQILPKPIDWDNPIRNAGIYSSLNSSDPIVDLVNKEFTQKRLRSYLNESELTSALTGLYRSSKLSLEENGANTLYIALGLMKWFETDSSEKPRYAPILLLPIEIIRKSAAKGFIIRSREEETILNITLLEMLRQDFGIEVSGLDPLPKDDSGVDVKLIFNLLRQVVMAKKGWDIEEQAFIGTFSFNKFVMWKDIHSNADKLKKNKIVSSLISGKMEWNAISSVDIGVEFDKSYHPSDLSLPISADSSQLEAICSASGGESFVLHGPPGTGKSQTITNIIANALYHGKRVLFVAEKMAALSVVQSRLESIGISPFCLELHSNKSKKSAVLAQLKKITELTKRTSPEEYKSEADRLHLIRNELNSYVEALHKAYPFGLSLYDAFAGYAQLNETIDTVKFEDESIKTLTKEKITQWTDFAEELQAAGQVCNPYKHPLKEIEIQVYNQKIKNDIIELLSSFLNCIKEFKASLREFKEVIKIDSDFYNDEQYKNISIIINAIISLPKVPSSLIAVDNIEDIYSNFIEIAKHGRNRDQLRNKLYSKFQERILKVNSEDLLTEWYKANAKWFFPRVMKQNKILKELNQLSKGEKLSKSDVISILEDIINLHKEGQFIEKQSSNFAGSLQFLWADGNCEWDSVQLILEKIKDINRQSVKLFSNIIKAREFKKSIAYGLSDGIESFLASHGKVLDRYNSNYSRFNNIEESIIAMLGVEKAISEGDTENKLDKLELLANKWLENIEGLKDWFNWTQSRVKANDIGLHPLVLSYEQGIIPTSEIINSFKKGLFRSIAEYIFKQENQLASFNGKMFEEKIRKFREISLHFEKLTKQELVALLSSKIPSFSQEASQTSEIGILQRAIRNGGRGNTIRTLFDLIPNLLPRLCPCMLMSPISVAQYFEAGKTKFDLVVFDEASQMPTCEAIGAMARGENVIIVGDPKQMPPTSFFSTNTVDEDDQNEDLESILDDCLALSMPSKHLLWHYRSKHESLIAFSNANFYDNELLTFPSPDDLISKVTYIPVQGFYDKSKTRQNVAEAKAVVEEIIKRLSDQSLSKRSIGVVTFSSVQQNLIDDMLNVFLEANPELEKIAMESTEPIFIKNLENVQGDERDVILFSIGYGPDKDDRVTLNFGPINRSGGERRLNVAVSRARYEMMVFSTLKADRIDLNRTSSDGVAKLKSFLEFAEKGKRALPSRSSNRYVPSAAFIELVANKIRNKGFDVNTSIGCSGYKIDIGIVNKDKPHQYLLGVLCDGHNYKLAKTAKDREIVQIDVLSMLGWKIHRIWSTEWWDNSENVLNGIIDTIEKAQNMGNEVLNDHFELPKMQVLEVPLNSSILKSNINLESTITSGDFVKYEVCNLEIVLSNSSDNFLLPYNQQKICNQIVQVINIEGPISKNLLCKRVLSAWGIFKIGNRINTHFDSLFDKLQLKYTGRDNNRFFWSNSQTPSDYCHFRVNGSATTKRDVEDIAPEEISGAVKHVLTNQISLPINDLVREVALIFGFSRIGNNVEAIIKHGINLANQRGYARVENNRVIIVE